jgi:hypothetical protein
LFNAVRQVVDWVAVGPAEPGYSFTYNPIAGRFGKISTPAEIEVVKAAKSDDYGSPGRLPQSMPLQIHQQPASLTIEVAMDLTLTVEASGMPPPRYQWCHNGSPLTNETSASLTFCNIQPDQAGDYQVQVSSGSTQWVSSNATLTVNTNPYVKILHPPSNLAAYEGQTARFSVSAKGIPPPRYQWQVNGVDIEGAQQSTLDAGLCALAMSGTRYSVQVWNEHQAVTASAQLTVSTRPKLAITEMMSLTSFGHADWFEVTNYDTNAIDMLGFRFSDRVPDGSGPDFFHQPEVVTITNSLIIKPRESIIFVHRLSAEDFIRWWGRDNLPTGLQIYTYSGFAVSVCGQTISLWNAATVDDTDSVAATTGLDSHSPHSWVCSTNELTGNGYIGNGDVPSILGLQGAWAASQGGDIGSPGLTEITPPQFLGIARDVNGILLKCRGTTNKTYQLLRKTSLTDPAWLVVTNRIATNALPFFLRDPAGGITPTRFYRLEEQP